MRRVEHIGDATLYLGDALVILDDISGIRPSHKTPSPWRRFSRSLRMTDNHFQARLDMALEQFALEYLCRPFYALGPWDRATLTAAMEKALRAADGVAGE